MRISKPFTISICNKQTLHPLQAASNTSGDKLVDLMANNTEYTPPKRSSFVAFNDLILPPKDTPAYNNLPEFLQIRKGARDAVVRNARNTLWLKVCWREKREDAQFARMFELALPTDTDFELTRNVAVKFAEEQLVNKGMVADLAIHESHVKDSVTGLPTLQSRTAYFLCTTRPFENGDFTNKNRDWNKTVQLITWRNEWFDLLSPLVTNLATPNQSSKDLLKFCERFSSTKTTRPAPPQDQANAPIPDSEPKIGRPRL
jgi:hypothetical protein